MRVSLSMPSKIVRISLGSGQTPFQAISALIAYQALAAALGVPEDAALALPDLGLGSSHTEVLIVAGGLLDAGVEHHEVVDDLEQPLLVKKLAQFSQQRSVSPNFSPNRSTQPRFRTAIALLETSPVPPAICSR
jgi:hypothetical protein